jgi:hypothetical protein
MNQGERDELLSIIKLIDLRDRKILFDGFIINSIKVKEIECLSIPNGNTLEEISNFSDENLLKFTKSLKVGKAPARAKADVYINDIGYSIKSNSSAPPALVNHTARPGFENVCNQVKVDISGLDLIIDKYWELRKQQLIKEDVKISHELCPFKDKKEYLRPILNYFLFIGSGSGESKYPASKILNFTDPINTSNWKIYDSSNALDLYWDKLIFSLRSSKGMPKGYPDNMTPKALETKSSVDRWTEYINENYRGALHIRTE